VVCWGGFLKKKEKKKNVFDTVSKKQFVVLFCCCLFGFLFVVLFTKVHSAAIFHVLPQTGRARSTVISG